MTGNYIGYTKVLRPEQDDLEKQIKNLNQYALEHNITFKIIFSEEDREGSSKREALVEYISEGDTVIVDSCFRLARTMRDLLHIIDLLENKKVTLISLQEGFNSSLATSSILRSFMKSMSQYEMNLMFERQSEGIKKAKELGKYRKQGRRFISKPDNFDSCYKKYCESTRFNKYTLKHFMADTGLKVATLQRFLASIKSTRNQGNQNVD
jgi:DNA invertase Pin-like site-specific DNA recombinase